MAAWPRLNPVQKENLLLLGGLFFGNKEMADMLGAKDNTIRIFRESFKIPLPKKKRPTSDPVYKDVVALFLGLKEQPGQFDALFAALSAATKATLTELKQSKNGAVTHVREEIEAVAIPKKEAEPTLEELAPHLYHPQRFNRQSGA